MQIATRQRLGESPTVKLTLLSRRAWTQQIVPQRTIPSAAVRFGRVALTKGDMAKAKEAFDPEIHILDTAAGSVPLSKPQVGMAVWGTYKTFRHLVAYVLTEDAEVAIQTVRLMGYLGLEWEAELVTLLSPGK